MNTQLLEDSAVERNAPRQSNFCNVHCTDDDVRVRLERWLHSLDLPWPAAFDLTVSVSDVNPFDDDDREVFRQPAVRIQAGPPTGTVRVEWEDAPAIGIVSAERAAAQLWLSPTAAATLDRAERTFLMVLQIFVLRRLGWFHLHGAALIDPRGRGWLFVGDSNSGKSTTSALLATRGWTVSTDDIGFMAPLGSRIGVMGALAQIALRDGGRELLGALGGESMPRRGKTGFWAEELGSTRAAVVVPEIIAFSRIGARTGLVASVPRVALAALLNSSPWLLYEPVFAQQHLNVLSSVAKQSRCYDLTLGPDLFAQPDLLEELVT